MTKWWVDPSFDPMQDLQDCKEVIEHQHVVITKQGQQLLELSEIVKFQSIEIACLAKMIKDSCLIS